MEPTFEQQLMLTTICFLAITKLVLVIGLVFAAVWAGFYL